MNFFGSSSTPSSSDDSSMSSSFDSGSSFESSTDMGFGGSGSAQPQFPPAPVLSLDQLKHANVPLGMSMSPYLQMDPSMFRSAQPQYVTPDGGERGRSGHFEFVLGHIGAGVGCGFFTGCTRGFLSEVMNPETRQLAGKPWMTRMVNATMKHGSSYAQICGTAVLLFSAFQVGLKQVRADDDLNSLAAGALSGAIYRSPHGARASAVGAAVGTILATAWVIGHPDSRQRVSEILGYQ